MKVEENNMYGISVFHLDNWEVSGYFPYVPQLGRQEPRLGSSITDWLPASVPGSVHNDLYQAGWIEDPYYAMNSLKCEWVENRWWAYRSCFQIEACPGRHYHLRMEGLDYKCFIYLNDCLLKEHEGTFTPENIDITPYLRGDNILLIIFQSVPDEESQAGHTSHTRTQKSRFSYKWDFSTRMVPTGIWRDVWIEECGGITIENIRLIPEIREKGGKLTVHADTRSAGRVTGKYELSVEVYDGPVQIGCVRDGFDLRNGINHAEEQIYIDRIEKWYPNGCGGQKLYDVTVKLFEDNKLSHCWRGRTGFCSLKFVPNDGAAEEALPYCLYVDDRRLYLKGVNLTPFDMQIGMVTKEKYQCFLQQIRDANINLVRVNGVGLIETEDFYDYCDEYGILVWQEFIQTSSSMDRTPPAERGYLELLKETSETAIKLKRNHVSLACYCGGNELNDAPHIAATYREPSICMLQKLIDIYDPGRMLFPTSASGPNEFLGYGQEGRSHDVHGPWNYQGVKAQYQLYNQSDSLLHGELGVEGMSHMDSLRKFLPKKDLRITNMKENLTWRHHGDWWDTYFRDSEIFGDMGTLQTQIDASWFIQAEGLRYALESNRRRKYRNSGSLIWAFNEPFPNVSNTNLVDFYGVPKMAYYFTANAYKDRHISMKYDSLVYTKGEDFKAEIWVNNGQTDFDAEWKAMAAAMDGRILWEEKGRCHIGKNEARKAADLVFPVGRSWPEVFLVRLTLAHIGKKDGGSEATVDQNEYLFSTDQNHPFASLIKEKESRLIWRKEESLPGGEHSYLVTNEGYRAALFVTPEIQGENEFLYCPESYVCLLPYEKRKFRVKSYSEKKQWDKIGFRNLF